MWLWLAARQFARVLACVLKIHPHIDQAGFLTAASQIAAAEPRIEVEITKHLRPDPPESAG
jgi:hypothetical protein